MPKSRRKLEVFVSPGAYMEKIVRKEKPRTSLRSVLLQQALFEEGEETEIFSSPRAYMEEQSSEFF